MEKTQHIVGVRLEQAEAIAERSDTYRSYRGPMKKGNRPPSGKSFVAMRHRLYKYFL